MVSSVGTPGTWSPGHMSCRGSGNAQSSHKIIKDWKVLKIAHLKSYQTDPYTSSHYTIASELTTLDMKVFLRCARN